ncbi:unnamed protein product [Cuscuta epithymum]|uniref:Protein TIC 40, chloroplastic n=1 Tax=Cuscuta epithymum TaxID=186058 RepID=A0AAV0CTK3_9ASTE|nr:unnamed protein product [Cuscuta epithymum]
MVTPLAMAASSSCCCPQLVMGLSPNHNKPIYGLPVLPRKSTYIIGVTRPRPCFSTFAYFQTPKNTKTTLIKKHGKDCLASISSSSQQTSSVGVAPQFPASPPSSNTIGSPLFWMGVGVALSALFSWAANSLKNYAMQQAFKTMTGQMNTQNNPFSTVPFPVIPPGSSFPFPPSPLPTSGPAGSFTSSPFVSGHATSSPSSVSQFTETVGVAATDLKDPPTPDVIDETRDAEDGPPKIDLEDPPTPDVNDETRYAEDGPQKIAFMDVSPEETLKKSDFENYMDISVTNPSNPNRESVNGNASSSKSGTFQSSSSPGKPSPFLTVEALEKMMENPDLQKMIYPSLPDEMRNPETMKWILQNPQYRQQLEDMLANMGGHQGWDSRTINTMKNFDLNNPDVKQQFDQIGTTPEDAISKIMANPDIAMAFQKPKIQAAIMDLSQNPYNIDKYLGDQEIMHVFDRLSQLFPGMKM